MKPNPSPLVNIATVMNFAAEGTDYDSTFEEDPEPTSSGSARKPSHHRRQAHLQHNLLVKDRPKREPKADQSVFREEASRDEGRRIRAQVLSLSAYDRHKQLINDYVLYFPGATDRLQRDTSRDRRDIDVIRANHKFLWDDEGSGQPQRAETLTWGQRLAQKYYEKLFKEYCICDVSRYKENKVAMRWRTEAEVKAGKGQFVCGSRKCDENAILRTWEVNFGYVEEARKKNALVKVRLCPDCSYKLNYFHKKKDVTKDRQSKRNQEKKRKRRHPSDSESQDETGLSQQERDLLEKKKKLDEERSEKKDAKKASEIWSAPVETEQEKSREDDFSEYLEDLFM
ncbi:hypothetical protein TCAL_07956 [Tigriopus californicus]|uniref:Protein FRA10AC1 n=1 Tax=Tigriopus californicus TaxID=6832 RepID=A0A553NDX9_TIGCA|nr:protein FRA10AC1 homolog [Tigriopus californicus]TRY63653.1 hypothetical protein TCAL_07956 [Tigriopus californicus]|eukprot:TCALIF_07956-PA protein Name:"Similar to Fra10ac1 Protein FRA10AC1 homolog (Mus musculus)" AED:0.29 eAED:0.32 QI:0/-1/0/1/-1/1/1/0/340